MREGLRRPEDNNNDMKFWSQFANLIIIKNMINMTYLFWEIYGLMMVTSDI